MTDLRTSVNAFVAAYIAHAPKRRSKNKFIHDPLWGTIELTGHELCIVDTPLFQRLRHIHQTGNVFATFPSANHTRFEHSLGVLHIASRIVDRLLQKYSGQPSVINPRTRACVRLAALCHDLGHSAFSHTSEEFYSHASDLAPLLLAGGEFAGKGGGEVLSYLIVTSEAFKTYFDSLKTNYPEIQDISVADFAPLILGRRINDTRQFEADIISGPFDADKLDYFPRDGRAAGIEMAIDIDRLLHTMDVGKIKDEKQGETYSLIVSMGGYNSIQQLLFARATLFSSVYHHHKVRACDCMVKACYEHFLSSQKKFCASSHRQGMSLNSAADFLHITDLDFFAEAMQHPKNGIEHDLIHDIMYRRLLKRVLIISTYTVKHLGRIQRAKSAAKKSADPKIQKVAYSNFINLREDPTGLRDLARSVCAEAQLNAEIPKVWFDIPKPPSFGKAGKAMLNVASRGSGKCDPRPLSDFIPVKQWVETYEQYHSRSFLFGPDDDAKRIKLAVAAIKVLKNDKMIEFKEDVFPDDIREAVLAQLPPGSMS